MGRGGPTKDANDEIIDEYLDVRGNSRRFRLALYAANCFIEAAELRGQGEMGLRFVMPVSPGGVPPWGELRDKIRRRLAQRFAVRDARGQLQLLHDVIEGRLTCDVEGEDGTGPGVFIDDTKVSWDELGQLLRTFEGWNLRLEIRDATA